MTQTINIPARLMKSFRKDKALWETFVFAVCVKMVSKGDSKIPADIKSVRKLMGCSYYKAERMIEAARRHPDLFFFYENGKYLVARSFTKGRLERRVYATKGNTFTAYCAACVRFVYNDAEKVSHIAVSRRLRDTLITNAIKATQTADGSDPIVNSSRPSASRPLTLHSLSRASGYHHTTVSRHLCKMEKEGKVAVRKGSLVPTVHLESGEVLTDSAALLNCKRWYDWNGVRFVREPNAYSLVSPQRNDYAVNIIFNHKNRHRHNVSDSPRRKRGESYGDFVNRTVLAHLWL